MKTTNDLKKGVMVLLQNGWKAKLIDNKKGQIRYAEVYGDFTETGSVYSHNIIGYYEGKKLKKVNHTELQKKCRMLTSIFGL